MGVAKRSIRRPAAPPQAAQTALRRWKAAWVASPELLLCFDPRDGRVTDANPAACAALGWTVRQLRRKKLPELFGDMQAGKESVVATGAALPPGTPLRCVLSTRHRPPVKAYGQVHAVPGAGKKERLLVVRLSAELPEGFQEVGEPLDSSQSGAKPGATDPLTGLADRRRFERHLEHALAESRQRTGHDSRPPFAVLFVDLDGFKAVNDRFGHLTGDRVLAAIASRIARCVRPGDLVARFGGDEFTIFLDDIGCLKDAESIARRIARHVAEPLQVAREEICLGASVGIAWSGEGYTQAEAMLEAADRDMFQAKSARGQSGGTQGPRPGKDQSSPMIGRKRPPTRTARSP